MTKPTVAILGAVLLAAAIAASAPAISPTEKCAGAKERAVGRRIKNRIACNARAIAHFTPVDPNCVARTEAKFATAFAQADAKGPCPGTAEEVEPLIDDCLRTLIGDVAGLDRHCAPASLKGVGTAANCELGCAVRDITQPGLLATCHLRCDDRLGSTIARAGFCGQDPAIQQDVHECRDTIVSVFSSTTSTTSTTTSTSTTI